MSVLVVRTWESKLAAEREKLDVLKDIRQCLKEANERDNNFQQQLIELKNAKLVLEERRLALEEIKLARPSISVPIILPETSRNMIIAKWGFVKFLSFLMQCEMLLVMTHCTMYFAGPGELNNPNA